MAIEPILIQAFHGVLSADLKPDDIGGDHQDLIITIDHGGVSSELLQQLETRIVALGFLHRVAHEVGFFCFTGQERSRERLRLTAVYGLKGLERVQQATHILDQIVEKMGTSREEVLPKLLQMRDKLNELDVESARLKAEIAELREHWS